MNTVTETFIVISLRANRTTHKVEAHIRCNTCGYDGTGLWNIPMEAGHRFHCPACKQYIEYEIASVLPFIIEPCKLK